MTYDYQRLMKKWFRGEHMHKVFDWKCFTCETEMEAPEPPLCCGAPMKKVFRTVPGVFLKGDGWTLKPNDPSEKDVAKFKDRNGIK